MRQIARIEHKCPAALLLVLLVSGPLLADPTPGEAGQLLVTGYDKVTEMISFSFTPACASPDHHVEFGPLSDVGIYGYTGQDCAIGSSGTYTQFAPGAASYFFIVVGDDGLSIEGSYGRSRIAAERAERPEDLLDPSCAYTQMLSGRCDVPLLEISAYRPQSEAYGSPFQRTAVPAEQLLDPGVGMRINGDDDDGDGTPDQNDPDVSGENDLIEVVLSAEPLTAPVGQEYVLRRSNSNIRVWSDQTKVTEIIISGDEALLTFDGGPATLWVENPVGGQAELELLALEIADQSVVAAAAIHCFAHSSIVIALGGEDQTAGDPPPEPNNFGTFVLAIQLYQDGYDVHMYDEDVVGSNGAGAAYDEVVSAITDRAVTSVAIYGYSHGGGSTNDLARRLDDNRVSIGTFSIDYTAYMDGIDNDSNFDIGTETDFSFSSTAYHVNYYENPGCGIFALCGGPIAGAAFDLDVNTTPWGAGLGHFTVDDAPEVLAGIGDMFRQQVSR